MNTEAGFTEIGIGLTVFDHAEPVEGPVRWLDTPQAVLDFVASDAVADTIVLARGGTTTFLTPVLAAGVKAVMTLQGAPTSHLGILSREYGIPCLMSVAFTEGISSSRGETIPPDGSTLRLDVSSSPHGRALIANADRDYGFSASGPTEPDPAAAQQAEQLGALMAAYRGEIAPGPAGDRQLRRRLRSGVLHATPENLHRDLSRAEIDDFLAYTGWNVWDVLGTRSTEGESGLIPRQEYETVAFVQQWATYAQWMQMITDRVGVDGVIELGRIPRREIGTKANHIRVWAIGACPLLGGGIAKALGHQMPDEAQNHNTIIQFMRRLQYGLWGEGPGYVSGRGYRSPVLESSWIDRFREEEHRLRDPDELAAFRSFNAATELSGFLLHYDCRAALNDTGPYPLPDGGFVIVRDHFLHETAHEWTDVYAGLPYCVTQAMFFRPDTDLEVVVNDIATTFTTPPNYLKHLSGVAVYARDRWDTPAAEVRPVDFEEMASIVQRCNAAMLQLYVDVAAMSWDDRIHNGVKVYNREMFLPFARHLGLWEQMIADGIDTYAPMTEAAYPILTGGSGEAQQLLGAVFLAGEGVVPPSGLGQPPQVGAEAFPSLHRLALRGLLADIDDAQHLLDAELVESSPVGYGLTERGRTRHADLLAAEIAAIDLAALAANYDRFLVLNSPMKALSTRAAATDHAERSTLGGEFDRIVARTVRVLRRTAEILPRFGVYEERLTGALARVAKGDTDYLVSPLVESVHTVWMELHEDYLQTLGRDRETEGSF